MAESHKWLKPKELREISRAYGKPYANINLVYTISRLLADLEAAKSLLEQLHYILRPRVVGEVSPLRTLLDEIMKIPGVGE